MVLATAATVIALIAAGAYIEVADRQFSRKVAVAIDDVQKAKKQVRDYFEVNGTLPEGNKDLDLSKKAAKRYSGAVSRHDLLSYTIYVQHGVITLVFTSDQGALAGHSIRYSPALSEGRLDWICLSTLPGEYLPPQCRRWRSATN